MKWIQPFHDWFLDRLSIRAHQGLHPKNVYNYRSDFFVQSVGREDVVVDIACGTGQILKAIGPRIKKGVGLDYDPKNLQLCRKQLPANNLEFRQADVLATDYHKLKAETGFDTAILSHILEHVKEPVGFLEKIGAKKLLICVPSQENWRMQLKKSLNLPILSDPTHFREYTRDLLEEELGEAGYQIESMGFNQEGEIICKAFRPESTSHV